MVIVVEDCKSIFRIDVEAEFGNGDTRYLDRIVRTQNSFLRLECLLTCSNYHHIEVLNITHRDLRPSSQVKDCRGSWNMQDIPTNASRVNYLPLCICHQYIALLFVFAGSCGVIVTIKKD